MLWELIVCSFDSVCVFKCARIDLVYHLNHVTFVRVIQFSNSNIWQVCTNVLILCVGRNDSEEQCPYRPKPYAKYGSCFTFLCSQTQIYNLSFPLVLFSISELVSDVRDGRSTKAVLQLWVLVPRAVSVRHLLWLHLTISPHTWFPLAIKPLCCVLWRI